MTFAVAIPALVQLTGVGIVVHYAVCLLTEVGFGGVSATFLPLMAALGRQGVLVLYGLFALAFLTVVIAVLPETKERHLSRSAGNPAGSARPRA